MAANWKMHKTLKEAESFAVSLRGELDDLSHCDLVIYPPFPFIHAVAKALDGTGVSVGAQDLFWEEEGAFTGEISGWMIRDVGGNCVLVGHSERRSVFGESDEVIARKLRAALASDLRPTLCVGEKLQDREAGKASSIVGLQLDSALRDLTREEAVRLVIAYEPVWAIGTGRTATPKDAVEMHTFIRRFIAEKFGEDTAGSVRIQYGGSVKPENASDLLENTEIDGALIGGASLRLDKFIAIAKAAP
jgi:triosephosphate isomerase